MNQVNTEDKIIWSIGLGKSVEQLNEHRKNVAEAKRMRMGNALKEKTLREPPEHFEIFGLISKSYEKTLI